MKQTILILLLSSFLIHNSYSNKGDTTINLLNKRITCTLTKGYTEFTNQNLMAPEPSKEKEQYLKIKEDGAELTVYANELFVRTSGNTETEIKDHITTWKNEDVTYSLSGKTKGNGQHFIKYTILPNKVVPAANTLFCSVFVENFDSTLISLGFYLNKNALQDEQKWKGVIEKIITSIAPGSRQLSSNQTIAAKTLGDKKLELPLTKNYGLICENNHNMFVTDINQISSLAEMPSKMTIYSGMYPSEFFKGQGIEESKLGNKKIKIGSDKFTFKTFTNGRIWAAECLHKMSDMVYLHFILVCYNESIFNEMFGILEQGKLK